MKRDLLKKIVFLSVLAWIPAPAFGLDAPSGFLGTALSTNAILWTWNDNSGDESGYRLVDDLGSPVSPDLGANSTFYLETDLNSNSSYLRKAVAFNAGGISSSNALKTFTLTHAPYGLLAISKSMNSLSFVWSSLDYNKPSTRYGVERSSDPAGVFSELVGLLNDYSTSLYANTGLSANTTYYYRISGFNGDGVRSGSGAAVSIKTLSPLPGGIAGLQGTSASDRTVYLSWNPVSDGLAAGIRIVRTGASGSSSVFDLPVTASSFTDATFSRTASTFTAVNYAAYAKNSDGNLCLSPSIASVVPIIQFQYADTDGDGNLEQWDVANSTYSDPSKSAAAANRLARALMIGNTQVLLIDIFQRSSVPTPMDFDGLPDAVWQPYTGIVNAPILGDFDGDGLKDLGLDLDNDGRADGALVGGSIRYFGQVTVNVKDGRERTLPNAKVSLILGKSVKSIETDRSGCATFRLDPVDSRAVTVKVKAAGFVDANKTVAIDLWGENSVSVSLAAASSAQNALDAGNYPNPVPSGGTIHVDYHVVSAGNVRLDLYDINFRFVRTILNEWKDSGSYHVSFEAKDGSGNDLSKGLFFGVLTSGEEKIAVKIVVR